VAQDRLLWLARKAKTPVLVPSIDRKAGRNQGAALQKPYESGISSECVPLGIDGQKYELNVARAVGSLRPFHGLITLAESKVDWAIAYGGT
jgi:hypothetical protein